jgi:hypothetical protein
MTRISTIPLIASMALALSGSSHIPAVNGQDKSATSGQAETVTFKDSVAPLLKEKCAPCHFKDGKVFDRYPFDQYETVRKLGKRLNTRLKDENADLVSRWIRNGLPERRGPDGKKP